MLRTQIYLPEELKKDIDRDRAWRGESLAEYARQAMETRVKQGKKTKIDLKKLAKEITSGVEKSGWEGIDIAKWQREIRKDRKIL